MLILIEMELMSLNIAYLQYQKKKEVLILFFELMFSMSILYIMNFLITYIIYFFLLFSLDRISIKFRKMEEKSSIQIQNRSKAFASQPHKQKL